MEIKKAPKRTRSERDCVSRTYREIIMQAVYYDRAKKKEVKRQETIFGRALDTTTEGIVKALVSRAGSTETLIDFELVKAAEVRYIMTDADFITHATRIEEREEKRNDNQRSKKN